MRGILAAAGIAAVAASSVAPTPSVALAANVLTVTGYTFGGTIKWDMDEMFGGRFCSQNSGNSCTPVRYNSDQSEGGEQDGLRALTAAVTAASGPTTVLGFSQGATISGLWIRENAGEADAPSPRQLSFVMVANPHRQYGGIRPHYDIGDSTPTSDYKVLDIAVEYDGAADFPANPLNLLAFANALAGFQYVHVPGYNEIDLDTAEKLVWVEGNTTYVLIRRENLPLLEPLRNLGLGALADQLNAPLKEIIDSAYDRDYPDLVDEEDHAEVLQQALATRGRSTATLSTRISTAVENDIDPEIDNTTEIDNTAEVEIQADIEADIEAGDDSAAIELDDDASADSDPTGTGDAPTGTADSSEDAGESSTDAADSDASSDSAKPDASEDRGDPGE